MSAQQLNKLVTVVSEQDRELIKAIEHGLPLVSRPYAQLAQQLNTTEQDIIERLHRLMDNGAIKRYGVVVRHRELGYTANGMVVWNVPDDKVRQYGECIGKYPFVTLSYRRPRKLPQWPYNLFTMVHGKDRHQVEQKVQMIIEQCGLHDIDHCILFSTRRFKQRGASYTQQRQSARTQQPHLQLLSGDNHAE